MNASRPWTRGEDWVNLLAGIDLLLVPLMFTTVFDASANAFTLGPVIAVIALFALAYPRARSVEWTQLLAGAVLFIAPWDLGFSAVTAAAWNAWIVGALLMIFAGARLAELASGHPVGMGGTHLPHTA